MRNLLALLTFLAQIDVASPPPSDTGIELQWKDFMASECQIDDNIGRLDVVGTIVYENRTRRILLLLRKPHESIGRRGRPVGLTTADQRTFTASFFVVDRIRTKPYGKEDFVRLRPKESYSEPYSFSLFFRRTEVKHSPFPPYGDYSVEVQVSVWRHSLEEAEKIGKSLGKIPIWTQSLWSEPIAIQVSADTLAQACPSN
jgi:hypothetical protein